MVSFKRLDNGTDNYHQSLYCCKLLFLKVIWVYCKQVLLLLGLLYFGFCTIIVSMDVYIFVYYIEMWKDYVAIKWKLLFASNKMFDSQQQQGKNTPSELFIGMWVLERFNRGVQIASIIVALNPFPKMMIVMLTLSVKDI